MFAVLAQTTAAVPRLTGTEVLVGIAAAIAFFAWLGNAVGGNGYSDADCERFASEACTYLYEQECVPGELIDLHPYIEMQPYAHDQHALQRIQAEMAKFGARAESQPDGATLYRISNKLRQTVLDRQMSRFAAAATPQVNVGPGGVNVVQTGASNKIGDVSTSVEADPRVDAIHAELVRLAFDTRLRGFHQTEASNLAQAVETARQGNDPAELRGALARVSKFAADVGPIATLLSSLATAGHQVGAW